MMAAWDDYEEVTESRRVGGHEDLRSPLLRGLVAMWESRHRPDGGLPGRADFQARDLLALGGIVTLFDVEQDPFRMRVRLVGTRVTQVIGRDVTGLYLEEAYRPEVLPLFLELYARCIRERRPIRTAGRQRHIARTFLPFESIDLPLATDGQTVDMIMKGSVFDEQVE